MPHKKIEKQKILLLIRCQFLLFLYEKVFEMNGFEVISANTTKTICHQLRKNNFDLIVFGMLLSKIEVKALVRKALTDKIPVLIFIMNQTKNVLEDYLQFDQYNYVDTLNDNIKDIVKKAKKMIEK